MGVYYSRQAGPWDDPNTWTTDPSTDAPATSWPGQSGPDDTAVIRHRVTLSRDLTLHGDPGVTVGRHYGLAGDRVAVVLAKHATYSNYDRSELIVEKPAAVIETTHVVLHRTWYAISGVNTAPNENGVRVQVGHPDDRYGHNGLLWRFVRVVDTDPNVRTGFASELSGQPFTDFHLYGDLTPEYRARVTAISGTTLTLDRPIRADPGDLLFITPTDEHTRWEVREVVSVSGSTVEIDRPLDYARDTSRPVFAWNMNRAINVVGGWLRFQYAVNGPDEDVTLHAVGMPDEGNLTTSPWNMGKIVRRFDWRKSFTQPRFASWEGRFESYGSIEDSEFAGIVGMVYYVPQRRNIYYNTGNNLGVDWGGSPIADSWVFGRAHGHLSYERVHFNTHLAGMIFGGQTDDLVVARECVFGDVMFSYSYQIAAYLYFPLKIAVLDSVFHAPLSSPRNYVHTTPHPSCLVILKNARRPDSSLIAEFWGAHQGYAILERDETDKLGGEASLRVTFEHPIPFRTRTVVFATRDVPIGVVGAVRGENAVVRLRIYGAGVDDSVELVMDGTWRPFAIGGVPTDTRSLPVFIEVEQVGAGPWWVQFDSWKIATGRVDTGEFETFGEVAPVSPFPQVIASTLVGAADIWNAPTSIVTAPNSMGEAVLTQPDRVWTRTPRGLTEPVDVGSVSGTPVAGPEDLRADLTPLLDVELGRWAIEDDGGNAVLVLYRPDNVTEIARFALHAPDGSPLPFAALPPDAAADRRRV